MVPRNQAGKLSEAGFPGLSREVTKYQLYGARVLLIPRAGG